jgi:hypothetical protein
VGNWKGDNEERLKRKEEKGNRQDKYGKKETGNRKSE